MNNKLKLEIDGFGVINKAKIDVGKINVVGGVNSSGKSTVSKLLYCYLKAMSLTRKEYALKAILLECLIFAKFFIFFDLFSRLSW